MAMKSDGIAKAPRRRPALPHVANGLATMLAIFLCTAMFGGAQGLADEIDVNASRVYIRVGKVGFGHEHAVVGRLKAGNLRLDATDAAGELVFDIKSFEADTTRARKFIGLAGTTDAKTQQEVNANMLGPDVLDVKKFPTATFAVQSAKPLREKSRDGLPLIRLEGDFTLHGVKRPLEVTAELVDTDGGPMLRGAFVTKQSSHGIKPFSKAFGAIGVADELTIHGEIVFAQPRAETRRVPDRR